MDNIFELRENGDGTCILWKVIDKSITTATIPNNVTKIGDCSFLNCSNLTSVTISKSVTSVDALAFCGCSNIDSIVVEKGNTTYHS